MRPIPAALVILVLCLPSPALLFAQSSQSSPATSVPRLINISGVYRPADKQPLAPVEQVTFAVYAQETGGTPLWQETQQVAVDAEGRYSVLLGATQPDGVPLDVFASGQAQWLGTTFGRPGDVEGARMRITSVPYALHAADAVTLGGRPASDYVLTPTKNGLATTSAASTTTASADTTVNPLNVVLAGTPNALAKYVNADDVGASAVSELNGRVGINTGGTLPFDYLHIRFNDPFGAFTGLAVQNLSNNANAASGMLFYDHNGALTQFQGFNNTNHGYVINNIAKNGANQFDGSYSFLIGSTPRFNVASNGNVGVGATAPVSNLEVSNALSPGGGTTATLTSYNTGFGSPSTLLARRARGTAAAPTALLASDILLELNTKGYGTTGFGPSGVALISMGTSQNWTDTAQGTQISFSTTPNGSTTPGTRMVISNSGNVGIGTFSPLSNLEVSNSLAGTPFGQVTTTTFGNSASASLFVGSKSRGTIAAPAAVQLNDNLAGFLGRGSATTVLSGTRGGMFVRAAENWTDTAQGASLNFNTTATGTITPATRVTISPSGNVGIGTTNPGTPLEIVRNGETTFVGTSFNDDDGSAVFFQRARGTSQTPSAVQAGDALGYFGAGGYGATTFGDGVGAMAVIAAQNWTDTANGTTIAFATTPLGTTDFVPQAAILPNGFLGLGTPGDANGIPTATDRLQVFGDIRVGTTGTNGCLLNFAGTGLVGSCSSDRRLKKNITPFAPMLDKVTALQPVHYFWRSDEFPARHFGNDQNYGLIAQDVEQVLPELVVTNEDGYKAVDYSKLPLLTIQAVKDLKAENDTLKLRMSEMDRQLAELERRMTELLATADRR